MILAPDLEINLLIQLDIYILNVYKRYICFLENKINPNNTMTIIENEFTNMDDYSKIKIQIKYLKNEFDTELLINSDYFMYVTIENENSEYIIKEVINDRNKPLITIPICDRIIKIKRFNEKEEEMILERIPQMIEIGDVNGKLVIEDKSGKKFQYII